MHIGLANKLWRSLLIITESLLYSIQNSVSLQAQFFLNSCTSLILSYVRRIRLLVVPNLLPGLHRSLMLLLQPLQEAFHSIYHYPRYHSRVNLVSIRSRPEAQQREILWHVLENAHHRLIQCRKLLYHTIVSSVSTVLSLQKRQKLTMP